jgi:vacuolar-type H+-ATPase subunit H
LLDEAREQNKENLEQTRSQLDRGFNFVRDTITSADTRFDTRRDQIRGDMDTLEQRINDKMTTLEETVGDKIQKALENPLANMRK